ncbi:hypothetical protein DPMN_123363 [Dreissena polymorpha]|uniref:Uncharacterized protein n=2 Tax=Dreissena polymorpha TaxID=45954 RepID=A0A9D4JST7_DREPO|nr:hypothetical protein DPMN_123363 [Dreissena polymorpha]
MFPGLFPAVQEYQRKTGLPILSTNSCLSPSVQNSTSLGPKGKSSCLGMGDGDDCCETFKHIVPYDDSTFRIRDDVDGEPRHIIQLFTRGTCGSTNDCQHCQQENNLMGLLAIDLSGLGPVYPFGFYMFQIESYCSCQSYT